MQAVTAQHLTETHDEDWYRNPRAGADVQALMSRGQETPAHGLVEETTGSRLSFDAVVARLERVLQ